jgi:hypothetical protein
MDPETAADAGADEEVAMAGAEKAPSGPRRCERCSVEMVSIHMSVDGNELVMESCQRCDVRRWHLAGREINLEQALAQVGEHVGRRR